MSDSRKLYSNWFLLAWFLALKNYPRVKGRENIPEGVMLICANHTASLDPMIIMTTMTRRRQIHFMAKAEWFEKPFIRRILSGIGMFPVKRGGRDIGAMKTALKYLHDGETVAIFPQGTRRDESDRGDGKAGAAMLAIRTGVPVLPVFIQSPKRRGFRRIDVVIGEPFIPETENGKPNQNDYRRVADEIMERIWALEKRIK